MALSSHSLCGKSLDDLMKVSPGIVRIVGIEVENRTRWSLTQPRVFCVSGTIKLPPRDIEPYFREAMVATKPVGGTHGTRGSVSWYVNPDEYQDRRAARLIVVNWSNPLSFDFHANTLAIGISHPGYSIPDPNWTDAMHKLPHKYEEFPVKYERKEFKHDCGQIEISDEDLIVTGVMGTTHDAKIHVVVKEWN